MKYWKGPKRLSQEIIPNCFLFTIIHWMPQQRILFNLDSITYKSSTGIALHDLRNDWVDNLYLLWGASYYLKKKFDSAYLMFQFINYAFAKKKKMVITKRSAAAGMATALEYFYQRKKQFTQKSIFRTAQPQ